MKNILQLPSSVSILTAPLTNLSLTYPCSKYLLVFNRLSGLLIIAKFFTTLPLCHPP
ncbi:hypothetical protein HMPREF1544_00411 [Mucor circinelloides 1006PhL]|uniref:Uncharacterized protein n=1 Tax=Mucor circinelloides f. circinelloides (strain 1006PhL) TaxID=1220926 RepID=S2JW62_MUCC1|nr:hypothetical protein HMPREF1544_00411 [Mucor circinelloides 1006PhL]